MVPEPMQPGSRQVSLYRSWCTLGITWELQNLLFPRPHSRPSNVIDWECWVAGCRGRAWGGSRDWTGRCESNGCGTRQRIPHFHYWLCCIVVLISGVFFTVLLRYPLAINSLIQNIGSGREVQEGRDVCISTADSCCYMAVTNTIIKAIILQLKIYKI